MLLTPRLAYEREFFGTGIFQCGPASALFRADAFRELGGFPEAGVASDLLFWLRACAVKNVLLVSGDLFFYRVHANQEYASAGSVLQYANARGAVWRMLNPTECPLGRTILDGARTNFLWTVCRDAFREFTQGRFAEAVAILRGVGLDLPEWLRYLRFPNRSPNAGTPPA